MKNEIIAFIRKKDYRFIKNIGQGGTGKTVLLKDETIDEFFVCKKYSPLYDSVKEKYFKNFVDEIKILYSLNFLNVVRVFNYYLYPELFTGYILMEYVKGSNIYDYIKNNPDRLNDIFIQTIEGFRHLEDNKILHRDIRPDNIMVSENGIVKIIDFGFGKNIEFADNFDKSISLNWRYSIPNEFSTKTYDFRTELYFVGKLFEELIKENQLENFAYSKTLGDMIDINYETRIQSFFEISRVILSDSTEDSVDFSYDEKQTYRNFAFRLENIFSKISQDAEYNSNIDSIVMELDSIYRNSILEDIVQNPSQIGTVFVKGEFFYNKKVEIYVDVFKAFLKILKSSSIDKKKIIINNLWQRLDKINRYPKKIVDDLPF